MATDKVKSEQALSLNPAELMIDDNIRFGYVKNRVEALKDDVKRHGGIHTPITVELLSKDEQAANPGMKYRVTDGHYRTLVAQALNNEEGADIKIPAFVRSFADPAKRALYQLSTLMERTNPTPMDSARAIQKLMDMKVEKAEIRRVFRKPTGKANKLQDASNSWINITHSFMDLPKAVQEKLHDGRLTWSGGYELMKAKPENREKILADAEAERLAQAEREDKDEIAFLDSERKVQELKQKEEQAVLALEAAKNKAAESLALANRLLAAEQEKYTASRVPGLKKADLALAIEKWKGAVNETKAAVATANKDQAELDKLLGKVRTAVDSAKEAADKAKAQRDAAKAKAAADRAAKANGGAVGAQQIQAAAANVEPERAPTIPNLAQTRLEISELADLPGSYPIVQDIARVFKARFVEGMISKAQMYTELSKLTGEYEEPRVAPVKGLPAAAARLPLKGVAKKAAAK